MFGTMQEQMINDILSDDEDIAKPAAKLDKTADTIVVKPAMHAQIRQGISSLLDDDDCDLAMIDDLDDEDDADYDMMIEKDLDNWI